MIKAKYDWQLLDSQPDDAFLKVAKQAGLAPLASQILYQRGLTDSEDLAHFLSPDLGQLHDPYLLYDMDKAVARIRQAIEQGERLLVYGDYDADGMTAASIMKETLEMMGADYEVYLPNRFTDGYGPNQSVYQYFIEQQGISLIITVDNGVAGHEAIAYAMEQGVDVIVTDHHSLPAELPLAYALIHPEHPQGSYPFKQLAGCGVAFKLATALLEEVPTEFLDLVAIGTVADMMSLTGENRLLVKYGLQSLRDTERLGLQELLNLAGVDAETITEETIGFTLAPQLNALGRLDDPNPALDLLTGFDEDEAKSLAQMVSDKNDQRKELVQRIFDEAKGLVDPTKPAQVLAKEGWNPGVLGIVAGRLLEELGQPVIVLAIDGQEAKGSARSLATVDIFEALSDKEGLFLAFGGHSGAAGMTLEISQLERLSQELCDYIQEAELDMTQKPQLTLDAQLSLADLTLDTIKNLEKLMPFGMDHKKPVFWLKDVVVKQARSMGQGNAHLKLKISQEGQDLEVVAFGYGHLVQEFLQASQLELAVNLSVNSWNGNRTLQLMLVDARVTGVQLIDLRAKNQPLPAGVPLLAKGVQSREVVLQEVPDQLEDLKQVLQAGDFDIIYFKNQIKNQYYLTGYGTREQFAKLYKLIYQFPEFDIRYKLKELSHYLKIPEILLIKMIQIFEELDFVKISDGVMTVNKEAKKREIAESQIYQNLKQVVADQQLMALGTPREIYDYLMS
ncbi:single-stranded-DNA-specific exonuclease RecJ [Streptococcus cuniculipharyngis]|uniref:Single-stranded-DNA-specific exonuclease RecJ n=1 Tax=Streptococcus cuniculipharyngis TaxID=1562651 RepID=A0A5C5SBU5_9STRE|nr:single-stranded-DNA-specific exonuclease RecJ [Streptococcus cuniculipharyngis]TWS98019.1 single-stranded-DNA-specific exonuclease RecJ [Streptococcus cuniculipharyngis]